MIRHGMILAAGFGTRMRPLTDTRPKPMVEVAGRPMLAYALESLATEGVTRCVINTHYLAGVLHDYIRAYRGPLELVISHEPVLLDTGGGIKKGLSLLGTPEPAFVLSGDSILVDTPEMPALAQLRGNWQDGAMDILLSLQPLQSMIVTPGVGDYTLQNGKPVRTPDHSGQYMWNSARIVHPRIFTDTKDEVFSFLPFMDAAEKSDRLSAVVHKGGWHHLSTPDDVARVTACGIRP